MALEGCIWSSLNDQILKHLNLELFWATYNQTWICSISSGANSFCPSPPKNSFRSPPVLPSTSRSMKKSRSCSTPEIRCYNCVNNGYGSKKFMIYLISTRHLYLATLPSLVLPYVVSFWLLAKKFQNYDLNAWPFPLWQGLVVEWSKAAFKEGNSPPQDAPWNLVQCTSHLHQMSRSWAIFCSWSGVVSKSACQAKLGFVIKGTFRARKESMMPEKSSGGKFTWVHSQRGRLAINCCLGTLSQLTVAN